MSLNEFLGQIKESFGHPVGINLSIKELEQSIKNGQFFQVIWFLELS